MDKVEIRTISSNAELEQVYELWENVFSEKKAFFQRRLELGNDYDYQTTWIAKVNGKITASVQIFPYFTFYEDTILKVGGIGNVATHPDYRGMGLTHTILNRQTDWMRANGFDLSLLSTGINSFYKKVGWHTVEETSYRIAKVPELPDFNYHIEELSKVDIEDIKVLYHEFAKKSIGTRIRSSDYWEGQLRDENYSNFLVAKEREKVVAYLRYYCSNRNIDIRECCYHEGHDEAALSLLREMLTRNVNITKIHISFASNHVLSRYFQKWNAEEIVETSSMWKVIDFNKLMEKLRGTFANRIHSSMTDKQRVDKYTILLQHGNSEILLTKKEYVVDVNKPGNSFNYNQLVKYDESKFISMILNGSSENEYLSAIFSRVYYNYFSTDSF